MATTPLASREEWQAWRGEQRASVGGDDYVIEYRGYMKDTRVLPTDDPTYDIRWESTWFKNDPSRTTPYATGEGGFQFTDPSFNFDIKVDPLKPSNVTLSGGASTTLWGLVDVSISGSKDFGTGILKAEAGVAADIPYISDLFGPFASAAFMFEYNQKTGKYSSSVEAQVFYGLWTKQATVNGGKVVAPAVAKVPAMAAPLYVPPPNAGSAAVKANGGLSAPAPVAMPVGPVLPGIGGTGTTLFPDPYNPYGELADELLMMPPNNFTNVNQLVHHPGFIDPVTFPPPIDDPSTPPGGALGFSIMDPAGGPAGATPPGITLAPLQFLPEPGTATMSLLALSIVAFGRRRTMWRAA
jgi:hypothetical protein